MFLDSTNLILSVQLFSHLSCLLPYHYLSRTPLHVAAAGGNVKGIELLLERGADLDIKDRYPFNTTMHCASAYLTELLFFSRFGSTPADEARKCKDDLVQPILLLMESHLNEAVDSKKALEGGEGEKRSKEAEKRAKRSTVWRKKALQGRGIVGDFREEQSGAVYGKNEKVQDSNNLGNSYGVQEGTTNGLTRREKRKSTNWRRNALKGRGLIPTTPKQDPNNSTQDISKADEQERSIVQEEKLINEEEKTYQEGTEDASEDCEGENEEEDNEEEDEGKEAGDDGTVKQTVKPRTKTWKARALQGRGLVKERSDNKEQIHGGTDEQGKEKRERTETWKKRALQGKGLVKEGESLQKPVAKRSSTEIGKERVPQEQKRDVDGSDVVPLKEQPQAIQTQKEAPEKGKGKPERGSMVISFADWKEKQEISVKEKRKNEQEEKTKADVWKKNALQGKGIVREKRTITMSENRNVPPADNNVDRIKSDAWKKQALQGKGVVKENVGVNLGENRARLAEKVHTTSTNKPDDSKSEWKRQALRGRGVVSQKLADYNSSSNPNGSSKVKEDFYRTRSLTMMLEGPSVWLRESQKEVQKNRLQAVKGVCISTVQEMLEELAKQLAQLKDSPKDISIEQLEAKEKASLSLLHRLDMLSLLEE